MTVVHDLSGVKHLGVRLCDCSIPVTDISFKQLGKYVTLAINITVGSKDNAGERFVVCEPLTVDQSVRSTVGQNRKRESGRQARVSKMSISKPEVQVARRWLGIREAERSCRTRSHRNHELFYKEETY
ncbi:hypothetical protein T06_2926 [Trichinella sp. T6]|nr:hypothetical protein T06_2926 [Trichinella sp. T6]